MSIKRTIALSAILVAGFASVASAYPTDVAENKIGDRYPFLERTSQQPAGVDAYASTRRAAKPTFTDAERALFLRQSR